MIPDFSNVLCDLCTEEIEMFAKKYKKEEFYGFGMDCHSECGMVVLCFHSMKALGRISQAPSEIDLQNRKAFEAIERKLNEQFREKLGGKDMFPRREYDDDPESRRLKLKWSLGDWVYHGSDKKGGHLNEQSWNKKWEPISSQIIDAYFEISGDEDCTREQLSQDFLEEIYQTLVSIEQSGVFERLKRADDFRALILDHEQTEEEGWAFMKKMRSSGY